MSPEKEPFEVRQETDALPTRRLVAVAAVAVVVATIAVEISGSLLQGMKGPPPLHAPRQIGPVLQTTIGNDDYGLRLRREQRAWLDAYGWVDRDAGVAHVPVERAIVLWRQRRTGEEGGAP
jgi:hypothetical protein